MKRQRTREERRRRRRAVAAGCIGYAALGIGCLVASFWLPDEVLWCLVVPIAVGAALGVWSIVRSVWEED